MKLPRQAAAVAVALAAWPVAAEALPRFAARSGASCATCHVDPLGGGLRNDHGRFAVGAQLLPFTERRPPAEGLLEPAGGLSVGADVRVAYANQFPAVAGQGRLDSLMLMEWNLYVALRPFDGLTLYLDHGAWGNVKAFILMELEPVGAYVMAGRFLPPYGLRWESHRTYVREGLGFGPRDLDEGVLLGLRRGPLHLAAAVLNGAGGDAFFDDNDRKAISARLELTFRANRLRGLVGASFYHNLSGTQTALGDERRGEYRQGAFGAISIGRFSYLAQADFVRTYRFATERAVWWYVSHQELWTEIVRGLWLGASWEYWDADLGHSQTAHHRVGATIELFPLPSLELKLLYRRMFAPPGEAEDGLNEVVLMVHGFL